MADPLPLVLASGSRARRELLSAAGLTFDVLPAKVDETAIRDRLLATEIGIDGGGVALALARAKASEVSGAQPEAVVIGADQVLALGSQLFEKPGDIATARNQLLQLRGRTHTLFSAVALASGGGVYWSTLTRAEMTMRAFSMGFLDEYLVRAGDRVTESVGAYHLEGLGLQLFEQIEGDYFTILGLPLLPLLGALRSRGLVTT